MPKEHRLTSRRDFKAVFAGGKTYTDRMLVLKVRPAPGDKPSRFAFSSSNSIGTAVLRNRAKRLLREAVRLLGESVRQTGFDAVLIARPAVRNLGLNEVSHAVEGMFRRAGLLAESGQAQQSK